MSAPIQRLRVLNPYALVAVHCALAHASRPDLFEAHERRARVRELTDRLFKIESDLIPTARDARWYSWLEALWSEHIELSAELRELTSERDDCGARRVAS